MITVGEVDAAGVRAVASLIDAGVCRSATYHAQSASTNTLALNEARPDSCDHESLPRLFLTDQQTAGRGRHGRSWSSDQGSLTFSLLVAWDFSSQRLSRLLSLAAGVGVARAIEFSAAPLQSRLKWPNDVYIDGGKVAGILIETSPTSAGQVVIGVGVNVAVTPQLEDPSAAPVRSLSQVIGRTLARYELLHTVVAEVMGAIQDLQQDEQVILTEFRHRCMLTGYRVTFQHAGVQSDGICLGVTDQGHLEVDTPNQRHELHSGEARLIRGV